MQWGTNHKRNRPESDMSELDPISRRHHYVPRFYLQTWQASDGKGLWLYRRDMKGRVRAYRRSPKSVGYVTDLYSLKPETPYPVLDSRPDVIERDFFALIDDAAASVHQKLLASGIKSLSSEDRAVWALFLNSLMERGPDRIEQIELCDSPEKIKDEIFLRLGCPDFLRKIDWSAMHRNSVRRALVNYISDGAFVEYVSQMRWATVDIAVDGEHLITNDKPVLVNGGSDSNPVHCLSIALSPRRLLIIHGDSEEFDACFVRTLAVIHNVIIVQQAERYVISSRELKDGPHTKYSRVAQEFIKQRCTEDHE